MEKFGVPRLRLWARMISSGLHQSTEEPPKIPAFHDCGPGLKKQKEDLSNALSGAAIAFAQAVGKGNANTSSPLFTPPSTWVDIRMLLNSYAILCNYIMDNILTDEEFEEQKENILCAIKKLD